MNYGPKSAVINGLAVMLAMLGSVSFVSAAELNPKNPLNPPGAVYWCPHKTPDQQYASTFQPGCSPLVDELDKFRVEEREKQKKLTPRAPIKIQDIDGAVSKFAQRYRKFLDCCANDLASMDELEQLQDDAYFILKAIQETGLVNMGQPRCPNCRGWTLSQIIGTVAQARADLRRLEKRLMALDQAYEKLDSVDYEATGKVRRDIQQEEKSISKDFRPKRPPDYAPTGTEIGNTTLPNRVGTVNDNTTLKNAFGADIGDVASPDSDQRSDLNPRRGADTQNTTLPTRQGTSTQDSTLDSSIGFEIGTPQGPTGSSSLPSKAGPSVGDSSLNSR